MNSKIFLPTILLLISFLSISQAYSQDSTTLLKKRQEILIVEKRLVDNKLKLETLQKSLATKSDNLDKSLDNVQESADNNKEAASDLQDNATSKKHARRAKKAAKEAKRSAKHARKAEGSKTGVESDVKKLQETIREDETKLEKLKADEVGR